MPPTRLAAVGAFVLGGVLLFGLGLFMIGDRRMMFGDTVQLHAEFAEIAGLENGAVVRVSGMNAGEVEQIEVPPSPAARFRVRMRVREDLRPLLRTDSVASIQNDGLVGNKFIQIDAGTPSAVEVPPGGTINSREPFDVADLLHRMSDTVDTIGETITILRSDIQVALSAVAVTARTAHEIIDDVGRDAKTITASSQQVAEDLQAIVAGVREGRGSVGKLLNDDALYDSVKAIAADAERTMASLREASEQARAALAGFRGEGGSIEQLRLTLQQTLESARDAMADVAQNTEALKRSFFFRGYFNRRGFFDLDDLTVQAYRAGALEKGDRRPLRIWIHARFLFEPAAAGGERLSDQGRARIDSAMSQFVKYPATSPIVVEGYAPGPTADQRFLVSKARAAAVTNYLIEKFELDPELVVGMPMGDEADGAPEGNRWDGVGLAMFVPRTVGN
jgi:phospholipid/cholesterol/gamma-HCH transport system substrate-binding protein